MNLVYVSDDELKQMQQTLAEKFEWSMIEMDKLVPVPRVVWNRSQRLRW